MRKSKRNFILIFGFALIVNLLFFPCNRIHYGFQDTEKVSELLNFLRKQEKKDVSDFLKWIDKEQMKEKLKEKRIFSYEELFEQEKRHYTLEELLEEAELEKTRGVSSEYVKVFFPLVISRANKYKAYVKWESSVFLLFTEKIKVKMELKKERKKITKTRRSYHIDELMPIKTDEDLNRIKQKRGLSQLTKLNMKEYEIHKEINEIYEKKNKEFHEKFGYDPYYHQIRAEGFFVELALLILIVGLAFTTLVGVRKIRVVLRKKKEKVVNRIKRRKTGVVLSLIGVGVLAVYLPFGTSIADEGVITLFSIAGITLFLVGIGMVIFSFFPDEANPKKKE